VDIHPRYQSGISIEQIRRDGFDFMAVKVSEAVDASFMRAGSADFLRRGKACGLLCLGYHYLRFGNEGAQARLFAEQLRNAGVPGMLDVEEGAGGITSIQKFISACRRHGAHVPLMYLPRWYWQKIGSPDLHGLPSLWASRYVTGDTGPASAMYARHNPAGWTSYGGLPVEVLQFTDKARVAGRNIDANHYRGTREQFAALIGGEEDDMTVDELRAVMKTELPAMIRPLLQEESQRPIPRGGGPKDATSKDAVAAWFDARINQILDRVSKLEATMKTALEKHDRSG
jgi:hypothetical protein